VTSKELREYKPYSYEAFLKEIAIQLAELNEFLRSDKSVVNVVLCASNDDIPVRIKE